MKVKVKHLVVAVLLVGVSLSLLQFVVIPKLQVRGAVKAYETGAPGGKEAMRAAIDQAPLSKRWELIREYMISYVDASPAHSFDVYVGPGSVMSSFPRGDGDSRIWSWEEKLPYLLEYAAEGPADSYRFSAANQLAQYYMSEGDSDQALAVLEQAEERGGSWRAQLMLERAKLYANLGDSEEAMRLIERLENEPRTVDMDFGGSVAQLKAKLLIGEGRGEEALEAVERELKALEERTAELQSEFPDGKDFVPAKLEELKLLREQLEKALDGTGATVSGAVRRSDGTPMARVGVFLRSERDVHHSIVDGEPYQTFTDAQGRYEFRNVVPGSYQLYLGLLFDQIDGWTWPAMTDDWIDAGSGEELTEDVTLRPLIDIQEPVNEAELTGSTVKFSWEPVEGAAHYTLYGTIPIENGTTSSLIEDRIADSEIELPVERWYEAPTGYSSREEDGKTLPDSASVLGFSNPDLRYAWYVEAYDKDGRLITRSNGYRLNENTMGALPFFYLKGRTLTAADRLILDGRLDEALAEYERAYEADSRDRHSLHMMIRIYGAKSAFPRSEEWSAEAIPYLEEMLQLAPGKKDVLFQLFDYYDERREWAQSNAYYGQYVEASGGKPGSYTQSRYATSLIKQKRAEEALVQFREAMERDRSHRFVGYYLAAGLYAGKPFERVAELAAAYPERAPYESGTPDWRKLVEALAEESRAYGEEYGRQLLGALEACFEEDRQAMDAIEPPALRAFADALRNVN
ncbi:tetratricopeptide repeat protein [Cohnella hongkongensis]|uniref:Tetratricopeptide repeat protein n=1 Tax=Cohnella hongkongensis TaxID=178337 RepID=A0ABV9F9Y3_9BACL